MRYLLPCKRTYSRTTLLGNRYYDPSTGRFLTQDPDQDGNNWYDYCANNPLRWADPTGLIHVVVTIGENGLGVAKVYADKGDLIPTIGGMTIAKGGELLEEFPVDNHTPNMHGNPDTPNIHSPYPPGIWPITGIGHGKRISPNWLQIRGVPATMGKWLHSGYGSQWQHGTWGCMRGSQAAIDYLAWLVSINRGDKHNRVTVTHVNRNVDYPSYGVFGSGLLSLPVSDPIHTKIPY